MADNKQLVGLPLCRASGTSTDVDISKCIICQKHNKVKTTTTTEGRQKILAAAEIRQDDVFTRISLVGLDCEFMYHCSNDCYTSYTLKKTLQKKKRENETKHEELNVDELDSAPKPCKILRGDVVSRNQPSSKVDPTKLPCIICGKQKHSNNKEKNRISGTNRAKKFLEAPLFFKDDVYIRTCDLQDHSSVFGADLYYHKLCLEAYLQRYKKQSQLKNKQQKQTKGHRIEDMEPLLQDILDHGYGLTLSEIHDYANKQAGEDSLTNKEVKLYMIKIFGDNIQFCKPQPKNQSLLVYSSKLTVDQVAEKLHSVDSIREAGKVIRQSLLETDFSLDNEFGDANQLEQSWQKTPIPHPLIDFLSHVFNVDKLTILSQVNDSSQPCTTSAEDDEQEETDNDEIEGITGKTENAVTCRIKALFQIFFYNIHKGRKKTPLHLMTGHSIHEKCKSKQLITLFNKAGLSVSYDEIMESRHNLAQYTIKSCSVNPALPSHFVSSNFTVGAMDNFDHEEASLSGRQGTHDAVMVLFQEVPRIFPSKPKLSTVVPNKLGKRSVTLLPCQNVRNYRKPSTPVNLPPDFQIIKEANIVPCDEINKEESVISMLQSVGGLKDQSPLTWSGIHAIVSEDNVPLQHVGFLPILPYPVTSYDTVYSCMKNFQSLLVHLDQQALPVACDEGVFHIAAEIQLVTNEFPDLVLLLGSFHMTKTLLACIGKYITGSGLEKCPH